MIHTIEKINEKKDINVYSFNNTKWYIGHEIGTILGYSRPRNAIVSHVNADDK